MAVVGVCLSLSTCISHSATVSNASQYFSLLLLLFFTCLGLTVSTLALDLQTLGGEEWGVREVYITFCFLLISHLRRHSQWDPSSLHRVSWCPGCLGHCPVKVWQASGQQLMLYLCNFWFRLNCCGVVSYKDWNILNLQTNFCFIPESCDRKFTRNFDSLCLGSPHYFLFKDILNQLQNTRNSQTSIQK